MILFSGFSPQRGDDDDVKSINLWKNVAVRGQLLNILYVCIELREKNIS